MKELTKSFALSPRGPALPAGRDSRAAPALASLAVDASSPEGGMAAARVLRDRRGVSLQLKKKKMPLP